MAFAPPDPIPSGCPMPVREVAQGTPETLDDFVGVREFTLQSLGRPVTQRVCGIGTRVGESVRFQEKDVDHEGKDVRTWLIRQAGEREFVAEALPRY